MQKEIQIQALELKNTAYLNCIAEPSLDVCAGPLQGQWHPQPVNEDSTNDDKHKDASS